MRIWTAALLGAGLLSAAPLAAQEKNTPQSQAEKSTGDEVAVMMRSMFKVEPLTAEQQARLPQAEALIARIMPPGTMNQIMGGMYDKLLGPIMEMAGEASSEDIARELGIETDSLELEDGDAARIAAILDPVWKERRDAETAAVQRAMSTVMTAMEPGMRKGMAEAYAVAFTAAEMADIEAFFITPSGTSFARKILCAGKRSPHHRSEHGSASGDDGADEGHGGCGEDRHRQAPAAPQLCGSHARPAHRNRAADRARGLRHPRGYGTRCRRARREGSRHGGMIRARLAPDQYQQRNPHPARVSFLQTEVSCLSMN